VDGFNLYYGALKGTTEKWLNLEHLARLVFPHYDIRRVKYFTAPVTARPHDPQQPQRQQTYLRALRTIPTCEIIEGRFYVTYPWMRLRSPTPGLPASVQVVKTEEKGSDVNIAAHLVSDAYEGRFDVAVVISNDSDLTLPIDMVVTHLGLRVDVISPFKKTAFELQKVATSYRSLRRGPLQGSQFPHSLTDANGTFTKPPTW
jgi:uncharacterized LabA/DUF88 family protein